MVNILLVTDFLALRMGIFELPETMDGCGAYLEREIGR